VKRFFGIYLYLASGLDIGFRDLTGIFTLGSLTLKKGSISLNPKQQKAVFTRATAKMDSDHGCGRHWCSSVLQHDEKRSQLGSNIATDGPARIHDGRRHAKPTTSTGTDESEPTRAISARHAVKQPTKWFYDGPITIAFFRWGKSSCFPPLQWMKKIALSAIYR
jgi:hypothetical protein